MCLVRTEEHGPIERFAQKKPDKVVRRRARILHMKLTWQSLPKLSQRLPAFLVTPHA